MDVLLLSWGEKEARGEWATRARCPPRWLHRALLQARGQGGGSVDTRAVCSTSAWCHLVYAARQGDRARCLQAAVAAAHLNADAMGDEVPAQSITRLQQGLPIQLLLPSGLPGGRSRGQGELPDLEPEPDQLLHHAVQSGLAAVP